MTIHTVLFIIYALCLVFYETGLMVFNNSGADDLRHKCIVLKWWISFTIIGIVSNMCILLLFTYMSDKFSSPLDAYWQKFLLVYQSDVRNMLNVFD